MNISQIRGFSYSPPHYKKRTGSYHGNVLPRHCNKTTPQEKETLAFLPGKHKSLLREGPVLSRARRGKLAGNQTPGGFRSFGRPMFFLRGSQTVKMQFKTYAQKIQSRCNFHPARDENCSGFCWKSSESAVSAPVLPCHGQTYGENDN